LESDIDSLARPVSAWVRRSLRAADVAADAADAVAAASAPPGAEELAACLRQALAESGPHLIEAVIPGP
jgi:thiamine pyrophosphate-dependent acetolactate synthase large subunit-like protein